jgi:hypothetical protein
MEEIITPTKISNQSIVDKICKAHKGKVEYSDFISFLFDIMAQASTENAGLTEKEMLSIMRGTCIRIVTNKKFVTDNTERQLMIHFVDEQLLVMLVKGVYKYNLHLATTVPDTLSDLTDDAAMEVKKKKRRLSRFSSKILKKVM